MRVAERGLAYGDDEIARYALAFLIESAGTRREILQDATAPLSKRAAIGRLLEIIDSVVDRWLLSSDYRVTSLAIRYCSDRSIHAVKAILIQLTETGSEPVREAARIALDKL